MTKQEALDVAIKAMRERLRMLVLLGANNRSLITRIYTDDDPEEAQREAFDALTVLEGMKKDAVIE